jgi:glycosyltransferase involved in cell wall biosynthesis
VLIVVGDASDSFAHLQVDGIVARARLRGWNPRVALPREPLVDPPFGELLLSAREVDEGLLDRYLGSARAAGARTRAKSVHWRLLLRRAAAGGTWLVGHDATAMSDWLPAKARTARTRLPSEPVEGAPQGAPDWEPMMVDLDPAAQPAPGEPTVVVGVGTPDWEDGYDLFVEVAHLVTKATAPGAARFVWRATSPTIGASMVHDVDRLGLAGVLEVVPSDDDPRRVLAGAHVLVRCGRRPMPFDLALEAAATGRPSPGFDLADSTPAMTGPVGSSVPFGVVHELANRVAVLVRDPEALRRASDEVGLHHGRAGIDHLLDEIAPSRPKPGTSR